jgi:hypothetical protein
MRQNYTYKFSWMLLIALAISMPLAIAQQKSDTGFLAKTKITTLKNPSNHNTLHLALPPLKPAATSNQKFSIVRPDDKLLADVQVFPNPITDQISVKYVLSRSATVSVKVMDVLGNDVITLVSPRIESGEQSLSYPIANKLQRGFYFVRVVAGTESVIKRISVL